MIGEEDFLSRIKIYKLQPTLLKLKVNNNLVSVVHTVSVFRWCQTKNYILVMNSLRSYVATGLFWVLNVLPFTSTSSFYSKEVKYYKLNNLNVS